LFKLGRFDESESIYRSLLFMNPDNYKWVNCVPFLYIYSALTLGHRLNGYGRMGTWCYFFGYVW
jgi:hypothetical protein